MRTGTVKPKYGTQAVIDMMMIGENPRKNGYHMMNRRRRRKKSISKKARGFYQKEESMQEKKLDFKDMLTRFAVASKKRHNDTDATIEDQQKHVERSTQHD